MLYSRILGLLQVCYKYGKCCYTPVTPLLHFLKICYTPVTDLLQLPLKLLQACYTRCYCLRQVNNLQKLHVTGQISRILDGYLPREGVGGLGYVG